MHLSKFHPWRLWFAESGLTALLACTMIYLIVLMTLIDFSFSSVVVRLFFYLILVTGVLTTFKEKWLHGFAIILAVAILTLNFVEEIRAGRVIALLNACSILIFVGLLLATLVFQAITLARLVSLAVTYQNQKS